MYVFFQATPLAFLMFCYLIFVYTYDLNVQSLLCYLSEYKNRLSESQLGRQSLYHVFCVYNYPRAYHSVSFCGCNKVIELNSKWVSSGKFKWFSLIWMPVCSSHVCVGSTVFKELLYTTECRCFIWYSWNWFNIHRSQILLWKYKSSFCFNAFISELWNGN